MMKNAVAAALAVALAPSLAHAEFVAPKQAHVSAKQLRHAVELTAVAMNAAMTVDTMVDRINGAYINGLRRCYNKGLANDPTLKGKVTLTFSVSSYGNVSGEATGMSKQVDSCVASQIKSWRFGRPSDKREANYRISLVLAQ